MEINEAKVLDHGYVKVIEHWGSDERIIESARMSTNKGFLGWGTDECGDEVKLGGLPNPCKNGKDYCATRHEGDEKLLAFLYEHKHFTPFEMAGMVIEVQAPIVVFREWHRHRTQCLPAGTMIHQGGKVGSMQWKPIEQIWENWHLGVPDTMGRRRKLPSVYNAPYRVLNESSLQFESSRIADVWKTGEKEIVRITAGDRSLRCSIDHLVFTPSGYIKAGSLKIGDEVGTMGRLAKTRTEPVIIPSLRRGINEWTQQQRSRLIPDEFGQCIECCKEFAREDLRVDHSVPIVLDISKALDLSNLRVVCRWCHRIKTSSESKYANRPEIGAGCSWQIVEQIQSDGVEECYDIEMTGPWNNFVANGFVVHNSYNEMSGRYAELPDLFYIPSIERLMGGKQATKNKQSSEDGISEKMAKELQDGIKSVSEGARTTYLGLMSYGGLSRELARLVLPVNQYSRMRASANLRNWLAFLTLRMDPAAQWEIHQYANIVAGMIQELFPRTYALYAEGK